MLEGVAAWPGVTMARRHLPRSLPRLRSVPPDGLSKPDRPFCPNSRVVAYSSLTVIQITLTSE
jgi:hypothetical protein